MKWPTIFLAVLGPTPFIKPDPKYFSSAALWPACLHGLEAWNWRPNLRMHDPGTGNLHGRPGKHLGLVNNYGFLLVRIIERQNAKHRPTIVRVVISYPINDATDVSVIVPV